MDVNDVMSGSDGLRILGDFWKKKISELRSEARRVQLGLQHVPRVMGSDGTVSIVKIVSLSPRVEKLKVKKLIKVSYLNYRESSMFRVFFGFLCMWTFYVSVYFTDPYILYIRIMVILHYHVKKKTKARPLSTIWNNVAFVINTSRGL